MGIVEQMPGCDFQDLLQGIGAAINTGGGLLRVEFSAQIQQGEVMLLIYGSRSIKAYPGFQYQLIIQGNMSICHFELLYRRHGGWFTLSIILILH